MKSLSLDIRPRINPELPLILNLLLDAGTSPARFSRTSTSPKVPLNSLMRPSLGCPQVVQILPISLQKQASAQPTSRL